MTNDPVPSPAAAPSVFRSPAFRLLVCFGVLGAIALTASVFGPRPSTANPPLGGGNSAELNSPEAKSGRPWQPFAGSEDPFDQSETVRPALKAGAAPIEDRFGRSLLGTLKGKEYTVWVYSARTGPVYTVVSADGRILQEGLDVDEVYRAFPDLPIESMRLDPAIGGAKLMHVEPRD
ncbi:MAG: hypothetical protein ACT4PL_05575 [Phycisphaerales bacterium]